jgi:DNA-directed RNA polymerase subunit RPC12/RpoP
MSKIVDEERDNIVRCNSCGKLIQYSQKDKKGDYESTPFGTIHWEYINCPNCKHEIQF